jgi:hypothetical protein
VRKVPCNVNAGTFGAIAISGYCVVVLQGSQEVFSMLVIDILNAKIVNDEYKHDGVPLMSPQAGCGNTLVVPMLSKSLREEVIGQFTSLCEAIDTFVDLKVDPPMVIKGVEIILSDKFVRDD